MRHVEFGSHEMRHHKVRAQMTGPGTLIPHHHEGWQQVQRLMRMSFPEWQGAAGYELSIPIIIDGYRQEASIEKHCRHLEKLALPSKRFNPMRPPVVWFDTQGDLPHDRTRSPHKFWIIAGSGIEWGDYLSVKVRLPQPHGLDPGSIIDPLNPHHRHLQQHHASYHRVRQVATVHLWEWFTESVVVASLNNTHYKIRKGDTLRKLASRFYGRPGEWRRIAKANHIHDPNHLKVGKTIKLP